MSMSPTSLAAAGGSAPAEIRERLAAVRARIAAAAERAGREPGAVTLVAVSKSAPTEAVQAAREAGQLDFGESRVQELQAKAAAVDSGVRWHVVGRLQRNKVKQVVGAVSLVHSVDRSALADALAARAQTLGRVQRVLLQVNVAGETGKGGCAPGEVPGLLDRFRALEGLSCEGLMTIPPLAAAPGPIYAQLRELRDAAQSRYPEVRHLSMGMSRDLEAAVAEGATVVRVGEAIFGSRPDERAHPAQE